MLPPALQSRLRRHEASCWAMLGIAMAAYYALVLTDLHLNLLHPTAFGRTFNSMLAHLLAGRFDVDPAAVNLEGFVRDGRVYAYWGIFCALLRLPLLAVPGGMEIDVTGLSCLVAIWAGGCMKLAAARMAHRAAPPGEAADLGFALLVAAIVLGGAQVGFLRVSLYQEVASWAATLAAGFVCLALRILLHRGRDDRALAGMAVLAGLTLLTRVSTGLGLYGALGLLLAVRWAAGRRGGVLPAVLVLAGFAGVTGAVNLMRWGNPLTFADYTLYLMNQGFPERMVHLREHGLFSLARIPFGLMYFFAPAWIFHGADGGLLLGAMRRRLIDAAELPPASFLLTDPLAIVLAGFLAVALLRRCGGIDRFALAALAAGLAVPPLLMLMAIYMAYRYRLEFHPLLDLLAPLGLLALARQKRLADAFLRHRMAIAAITVIGIAATHASAALYKVSQLGPAVAVLAPGVLAYYRAAIDTLLPR